MAYGNNSVIGIIFQDSYGSVGDTSSAHFIPFISEGINLAIPPIYSENMRSIIDEGDTYQGPRTIEGDLDCEAQPLALGAMLNSVLELTGSVNSDAIYTHTFKPRTSDFDEKSAGNPVTVYKYLETGSAMMMSDLNGNTLELGIANGELLKAKVGFVGGTFSQTAAVAESFTTGKRWTWDQTSLSIGGTAQDLAMDLTITVDETIEAQHTLNASQYPARTKRTGFRSVAVAGTLKFDNQDEYQEFISQSERELVLHFEGSTEIQSGYYDALTITLPAMRYEEVAPAAGGPGAIEVGITGRGKYSVDSATAMEITLVNTQATY